MFGNFLAQRRRAAEWMDDPSADPVELERSLKFIRRVNAWLGYTRSTLGHLQAFAKNWPLSRPMRILDIATGSADVPLAVLKWATVSGRDVRIVGLDLQPRVVQAARVAAVQAGASDRLSIVQGDATALPFVDGAFDYAMTSMFLHHLGEGQVVRVLQEMSRVAAGGIIAADLLRRRRAYFWISLFTFTANPMVRHDARASVAQAFTRQEIEGLKDSAGVRYAKYFSHFGHRFVIAGEKVKS